MNLITIVDYGMGNTGSVLNMLKKVGVKAKLASSPEDLFDATKIILPGVGAFDNAMTKLRKAGYVEILNQKVISEKVPILGICLGMQLFGVKSEEGQEPGFSWLNAETVRFVSAPGPHHFKIPHMGWNSVQMENNTFPFPQISEDMRFYFVHSLHVKCNEITDTLTTTNYGGSFTSAVCRDNILGVQFHPEKSHRFGIEFFRAFSTWVPLATAQEVGPA